MPKYLNLNLFSHFSKSVFLNLCPCYIIYLPLVYKSVNTFSQQIFIKYLQRAKLCGN